LRRHTEAIIALLSPFQDEAKRWALTPADMGAAAMELDDLRAAFDWATESEAANDLALQIAVVSNPTGPSRARSATVKQQAARHCRPLYRRSAFADEEARWRVRYQRIPLSR
jgi:hypothetical protein